MKRFHFTLQAVRTLRQRQEHAALEQYAHTAQREIDAGWRELRDMLGQGCVAASAVRAQEYHTVLAARRDQCAAALAVADRRMTAAMTAMTQARQQREIVEAHFTKQKTRHERQVIQNEQKMLDDLASRRGHSILSWNPTEAMP
jgi:flagellar export protein FliJ